MKGDTARYLRNVIVFALADGKLTDEEKEFVESLRQRLGIGGEEFGRLCREVKENPRKIAMPRDRDEAVETIRLLVETAAADRDISDIEQKFLRHLTEQAGLDNRIIDQLLETGGELAEPVDDAEVQAAIDDIYDNFAKWDGPTRQDKLTALGELGPAAVIPLLRVFESYRVPDGARDALELKALVAGQLAQIGDSRAVYYLAQQVNIGDEEDEITSSALRCASAEAIGRITGTGFSCDQQGVVQARQWWLAEGTRKHDRLVL